MKEQIKKIKEMAERGTEHERKVASLKLKKLCKKYGIKIEDLDKEERFEFRFPFRSHDERQVIIQVYSWYMNDIYLTDMELYKRAVSFQMTNEEYLDCRLYINHYLKEFRRELKKIKQKHDEELKNIKMNHKRGLELFNNAFAQKHHLFAEDLKKYYDQKELSIDEIAKGFAATMLADELGGTTLERNKKLGYTLGE